MSNTIYVILALFAVMGLAMFSINQQIASELETVKINRLASSTSLLRQACLRFKSEYGHLPESSDNARLMKILTFDNPKKIMFISLSPTTGNSQGEMIDPWGMPLKIDLTSQTLVIKSAGPDKSWGTSDDITQ